MILQFAIGSGVIIATILLHAAMFAAASRGIDAAYAEARLRFPRTGLTGLLAGGVIWVLLAISLDVWLWAGVLLKVGAMAELETAVYFALVSFTTLGFGDIVLSPDWRILSGLIAANGLIVFGWSTAFMVGLVQKLRGGP